MALLKDKKDVELYVVNLKRALDSMVEYSDIFVALNVKEVIANGD